MLALKLTITALCALGLYASVFMFRKSLRAGSLEEPSVVQRPAARLLFGIPNSAFGMLYYPVLVLGVWLAGGGPLALGLFAAACAAALMSLYLAYSLLFITKMPCPFCWTSHAINWSLVFLVAGVFKLT